MSRASASLSEGVYSDAERRCLPLIAETRYGTNAQLEVRRILLEAYIGQEKWSGANAQLDAFALAAGVRIRFIVQRYSSLCIILASFFLFARSSRKGHGGSFSRW